LKKTPRRESKKVTMKYFKVGVCAFCFPFTHVHTYSNANSGFWIFDKSCVFFKKDICFVEVTTNERRAFVCSDSLQQGQNVFKRAIK
jgi:hypothetical protein